VSDRRERLQLAVRAARAAGEHLARSRAQAARVSAESQRDVKLHVDVEAEVRIVDVLRDGSPFPILSEERGRIEGNDGGARWIVDPLDGSRNYLQGIPFCGVAVGLWNATEPLLGVVYDFIRDELFTGIVGEGAWRNDAAIRVAAATTCERAVLSTGFPAATDFSTEALGDFARSRGRGTSRVETHGGGRAYAHGLRRSVRAAGARHGLAALRSPRCPTHRPSAS
jgi:myo-inositol-1(or 4)-monophosphatase